MLERLRRKQELALHIPHITINQGQRFDVCSRNAVVLKKEKKKENNCCNLFFFFYFCAYDIYVTHLDVIAEGL